MENFFCGTCRGGTRFPNFIPGPPEAPKLRQPCPSHVKFFDDVVLYSRVATFCADTLDQRDRAQLELACRRLDVEGNLSDCLREELVRMNKTIPGTVDSAGPRAS